MNSATIALLIRGTRSFIDDDPSTVELHQMEKRSDGSGGVVKIPSMNRNPLVVRVIPLTRQARETLTIDGVQVNVEFILMAMPEDDVRTGDQFTARGRVFEVIHIQEKRLYQTKAELITVG